MAALQQMLLVKLDSYMQNKLYVYFSTYTKLNSRWTRDLKVIFGTLNLTEKKVKNTLQLISTKKVLQRASIKTDN